MWRAPLTGLLCLLLASCGISQAQEPSNSISSDSSDSSVSSASSVTNPSPNPSPPAPVSSLQSPVPSALPPAVSLAVPYTSQAPFHNWNEPYQDACEETALLTLIHYLTATPFTPQLADREIVDLTSKTASMGYPESITLEQLAAISQQLYPQYVPVLSTDVTVDSIKRLLAQGKPVIVPTAGRLLHNPNYSGGGPWYHMLVITGYGSTGSPQADYFLTNDSGTQIGESYPYPQQTVMDAIHDWNGVDEQIEGGGKVMMTLEKKG